jgi:hypothetical protein
VKESFTQLIKNFLLLSREKKMFKMKKISGGMKSFPFRYDISDKVPERHCNICTNMRMFFKMPKNFFASVFRHASREIKEKYFNIC